LPESPTTSTLSGMAARNSILPICRVYAALAITEKHCGIPDKEFSKKACFH